tara:strand:+ start:10421 stop:10951 length:531 start_codon:yes stop_codon:yes gene_type:complete
MNSKEAQALSIALNESTNEYIKENILFKDTIKKQEKLMMELATNRSLNDLMRIIQEENSMNRGSTTVLSMGPDDPLSVYYYEILKLIPTLCDLGFLVFHSQYENLGVVSIDWFQSHLTTAEIQLLESCGEQHTYTVYNPTNKDTEIINTLRKNNVVWKTYEDSLKESEMGDKNDGR